MYFLKPEEYPEDFFYHRTSSETYRIYLEGCWPETFDIGNPPQYAWKKSFFWGNAHIIRYERTDVEPDIDALRKDASIKHGIVTWIPYSRTDIPAWWKRLYLTDHFRETGYNILENDYRKHWNERSRRAIKKFEKSGAEVRSVDAATFIQTFKSTRVNHWYKNDYICYYRKMVAINPSKIRQWLVYIDNEPVAGLAVHDYIENHSVHLIAFTGKKAYPIQWGTALIDTWFRDSLGKWFKYLSFDQLRQKWWPSDQKGYTEFKENFIQYRLSFPKAYFKLF